MVIIAHILGAIAVIRGVFKAAERKQARKRARSDASQRLLRDRFAAVDADAEERWMHAVRERQDRADWLASKAQTWH